jgi:hypothetical protein
MSMTEGMEREPKEPRKATRQSAAKLVPVTVIRVTGEGALVEYAERGEPRRVTIPANLVRDGKAEDETLEAGVPYGVPWERLETAKVTPASIARALRNAGIWTCEDLRTKQMAAVGALQAAYRVDVGRLNEFATEFAKEKEAKE